MEKELAMLYRSCSLSFPFFCFWYSSLFVLMNYRPPRSYQLWLPCVPFPDRHQNQFLKLPHLESQLKKTLNQSRTSGTTRIFSLEEYRSSRKLKYLLGLGIICYLSPGRERKGKVWRNHMPFREERLVISKRVTQEIDCQGDYLKNNTEA